MNKLFLNLFKTAVLSMMLVFNVQAMDMNSPAPDFTLKSLTGENLKLSELRGNVVLLNFWASWCGPCRQEMPLLEKMHNKYKGLGFTVMGVNVEEDSSKAKAMAKKDKLSFPVLFDTQSQVSKAYQVSAMPSTVIIDRDGKVRYLHKGYLPGYEDDFIPQNVPPEDAPAGRQHGVPEH